MLPGREYLVHDELKDTQQENGTGHGNEGNAKAEIFGEDTAKKRSSHVACIQDAFIKRDVACGIPGVGEGMEAGVQVDRAIVEAESRCSEEEPEEAVAPFHQARHGK